MFKTIKKHINSFILIHRFPFLRIRNVFTDENCHFIKWISRLLNKMDYLSYETVSVGYNFIKLSDVDNKKPYKTKIMLDDIEVILSDKLYIYTMHTNSSKVECTTIDVADRMGDKFKPLGIKIVNTMSGVKCILVYFTLSDVTSTDPNIYGFGYETLKIVKNNYALSMYNSVKWLDRLISKIWLFPKYTWLDDMPIGWRKCFGTQMCDEIKTQLKKHGQLEKYRILQIKEKWGELRWYDSWSYKEINDIIDKYTNLSRRTCIICGNPATKISTGYISPYCDNCIGNRDYIKIEKALK